MDLVKYSSRVLKQSVELPVELNLFWGGGGGSDPRLCKGAWHEGQKYDAKKVHKRIERQGQKLKC